MSSKFLTKSPYSTDKGELIGRHPEDIPSEDFIGLHSKKNPYKVMRDKCMDCVGQQESEVRKCVSFDCPLWPYRMGTNPFRGKRTHWKHKKEDEL